MPTTITSDNLHLIQNSQFRKYAQIYLDIYENFMEQINQKGLALASYDERKPEDISPVLPFQGLISRNGSKSFYTKWSSPACEACKKGVGSVTFFISLKCHRHCYFCFNSNQENHEYFSNHQRDCVAELEKMYKSGQKLAYIALTGGEPLLYKKETIDFFEFTRKKFPRTHTRLYTSGDLLDQSTLQELKEAGLNEIRFSIKMEDPPDTRRKVYEKIEFAKQYIKDVMVEMPVIPGTETEMKELLLILDQLGISGINLLEFCYPFHNAKEFQKRGFQIKNPPYHTLYNYWYAGGLPVAQSEEICFRLLEFTLEKELKMGVHYCSLENKHTGQVFQQNNSQSQPIMYFSPADYFLKSAKVFGDDIPKVLKIFKKKDISLYRINNQYNFLEFHVKDISQLKGLDIEVAISSNIMEDRPGGKILRELKTELVKPEKFSLKLI